MSLENSNDELASLAMQLADNPATRKQFLKMTKQVRPDLNIPELDIEEQTNKVFNQAEQRVQALEAKLREKEAMEVLNKRRQSIKEKGLASSDEDVKAVEKLMLEKGITNHETAAEYHQWMKKAAVPTSSSYNPSPVKGFDLNKYWKNPSQAARNEALNALNDLRNPRRPIGL